MERIKKIKQITTGLAIGLYFSPAFTSAVQVFDDPTGDPALKASQVNAFVLNLKRLVQSVAAIVAVAMIIWGAFYMVTGQGNEERITKGKTILRKAIMGFILIIAAGFFVNFFIMALGGKIEGTTGGETPWF